MIDFSKRLHRLPLHARGAVEETTKYFADQALSEISPGISATELTSVLTKIRRSLECTAQLNELPPADRQQIVELPQIAADLAHDRIRNGTAELLQSTLPDYEYFQHDDRVWIPFQTNHDLSGHIGSFRSYTDPRIGHVQRQARVLLEGNEEEALLPPECLAFAPDLEAFEDGFRELECRIESETFEEQHLAKRRYRALVLVYTFGEQPRRVTLSAGHSDHIEVFTNGLQVFVLGINDDLCSVGVEIFDADGGRLEEFFFQEHEVEHFLGTDFMNLAEVEMLERIASGYVPCYESKNVNDHEFLGTWSYDEFRLELYDTRRTNRRGKAQLAYELFDAKFGKEPVFSGDNFHASLLDSIHSDATAAAVLSFLSLRPGDTDDEYFDDYTPQQLKWRDERAEDLGMLVFHLEERQRWRELHLAGRTKEAVLAVAQYGTVEDLCEVLDLDVFEAYDVVEPLAWEDSRLRMLGWEVLRVRNRELGASIE